MLDTDSVSFALRGHGNVAVEVSRRHPSDLCGQMDTLIASHALSLGATLVTNNHKHFAKVSRLENWT